FKFGLRNIFSKSRFNDIDYLATQQLPVVLVDHDQFLGIPNLADLILVKCCADRSPERFFVSQRLKLRFDDAVALAWGNPNFDFALSNVKSNSKRFQPFNGFRIDRQICAVRSIQQRLELCLVEHIGPTDIHSKWFWMHYFEMFTKVAVLLR